MPDKITVQGYEVGRLEARIYALFALDKGVDIIAKVTKTHVGDVARIVGRVHYNRAQAALYALTWQHRTGIVVTTDDITSPTSITEQFPNTSAGIRAWAASVGIHCEPRGRISQFVQDAYDEAVRAAADDDQAGGGAGAR